ncbi:hypothetical protein QTP70_025016, partial [Hemibagrus guttatus]
MASLAQRVASSLSLRNGVRCVPANGVTVEKVLLGIAKEIGYNSISSASCMNKAMVVFVTEESHVSHLTNVGIVVSGEFVLVSPLIAPTVRVTVSNVPLFIPNGEIERGLTRYGKLASAVRTVPLGCKNGALKHVMSFRRHVFMFLNEQELDMLFRVGYEGRTYMVYASTGNMKCFECGDVGHKRLACPHKAQASEEAPSQGNERARLGSREETVQGSKEEDRQEIEEEDGQEIEEEDGQEIEEEDRQDGGVQQSTEGDGRLNIEESTITDKVAGEREGVQTVNTDKSRAQVVEITETTSDNGDENIVNFNIEMVEPEADDVMSEVDEVSGSEGITGATGENRLLSSVNIRKCLLGNGITKLGHLLNEEGWIPTEELKAVTGLRSSRLAAKLQEELCNTLPSSYRTYIGQRHGTTQDRKSDEEFPGLRILPAVRTKGEDTVTDSILSFKAPQTSLKDMTKKGIYHITVKVLHKESLKRQKASRWPGMSNPDFLVRDRWRTLYKPPVEKRTADLQWRIIHRAVATDGHVAHLNPAVKGECRFCGEKEDLEHLVLKCQRLK